MLKEYLKIKKAEGPLIFLENIEEAVYGEVIHIDVNGEKRTGKIIKIDGNIVVAQVFQGTA